MVAPHRGLEVKIALLSWESLHSIPVGGVGAHVTELGAALQRRGHDVHVFTRIGPGQPDYSLVDGVITPGAPRPVPGFWANRPV